MPLESETFGAELKTQLFLLEQARVLAGVPESRDWQGKAGETRFRWRQERPTRVATMHFLHVE